MRKVVAFHLYNDFSGSPKVLSQAINVLVNDKRSVDLFTSNTEGFLSKLNGVNINTYNYSLNKYRIITLLKLFWVQFKLLFQLRKYRNQNVVFYINTLLPFGAAIAGRLYKKDVIYHLHETSIKPRILKKFLLFVVKKTSKEVIYVSNYLKNKEPITGIDGKVIYNALSKEFISKSKERASKKTNDFIVLMACSLKKYKGVNEFVELAKISPELKFNLILNATSDEIHNFFINDTLPNNLTLFSKQASLHKFYTEANLVLNLSHPDKWIETFGLTVLEAMQYGIPVIVPPVGGPAEIITHEKQDFCINSKDIQLIKQKIYSIKNDKVLFNKLKLDFIKRSNDFSPYVFSENIKSIF